MDSVYLFKLYRLLNILIQSSEASRRVDLFRLFLAVLLSHNYFHPLILSLLEGMTFSLTSYTMTISLINNTVFSGCCFIQETELKSSA